MNWVTQDSFLFFLLDVKKDVLRDLFGKNGQIHILCFCLGRVDYHLQKNQWPSFYSDL